MCFCSLLISFFFTFISIKVLPKHSSTIGILSNRVAKSIADYDLAKVSSSICLFRNKLIKRRDHAYNRMATNIGSEPMHS